MDQPTDWPVSARVVDALLSCLAPAIGALDSIPASQRNVQFVLERFDQLVGIVSSEQALPQEQLEDLETLRKQFRESVWLVVEGKYPDPLA